MQTELSMSIAAKFLLQAGASQVFMPQFSPQEVVRLAALHKVTAMIAVPTMIADLVYQVQCFNTPSLPGTPTIAQGVLASV